MLHPSMWQLTNPDDGPKQTVDSNNKEEEEASHVDSKKPSLDVNGWELPFIKGRKRKQ